MIKKQVLQHINHARWIMNYNVHSLILAVFAAHKTYQSDSHAVKSSVVL